MVDQLSKNITRCGLSNSTLNYLRVSARMHQLSYSASGTVINQLRVQNRITSNLLNIESDSNLVMF